MDSKDNPTREMLEREKQIQTEKLERENMLFCKQIPLTRWQSRSSAILQIPFKDRTLWAYFALNNPRKPEELNVQSQNRSETIFFNFSSKKFLRVADDCLTWSYYTHGPFQRLESGVWLPINPTPKGSQPETFVVTGEKGEQYEYDNGTGMVIREITTEHDSQEEAKNESNEEESNQTVSFDLEALRKIAKIDPENEKKNKKAWKEAEEIVEKLNKQKDMKAFREAVIKGDQQQTLEIKGNYITEAFEEFLEIYECAFEYVRSGESSNIRLIQPINSMNEAKFAMGVILPELCLYPKSLLKELEIKSIHFAGIITLNGRSVGYIISGNVITLNCSEKNIIKIQQGIHQAIFQFTIEKIKKTLPELDDAWKALNPPDFDYSINRQKVPKGIKGFISFRSTQHPGYDMQEIFFAMMKNPPTILNHTDITIAKKGHMIKNVLEARFPDVINTEWWNYVTDYKDVIELSLGFTDYFKEAHFEEEQVESK